MFCTITMNCGDKRWFLCTVYRKTGKRWIDENREDEDENIKLLPEEHVCYTKRSGIKWYPKDKNQIFLVTVGGVSLGSSSFNLKGKS